jgi:hypothetical protein
MTPNGAKVDKGSQWIFTNLNVSLIKVNLYLGCKERQFKQTCMVRVPELLSSSPWISNSGLFTLSANMNGLISIYVFCASQSVLSSDCIVNKLRKLASPTKEHQVQRKDRKNRG